MSNDISFDGVFDFDGGAESAEEQEFTEPVDQEESETSEEVNNSTEGVEEQEVTEPAEEKQSAEDNAKFAAARRKAEKERDDAIAKMKEDHEKEMDSVIASLGLENPYTGKAITTRAEMEAYQKQHAEEQLSDMRERTGLTEEDVEKLVELNPKYRQAMADQAAAKEAKEAADSARLNAFLEEAVAKIGKMDPAVKTMEDLRNHESYKEVDSYVRRGYSIPDAFYKANEDAIRARERAAIEQQIRNSMNGRGHLESSSPRGDGGINVPADVMSLYRQINPNASDDDIVKAYTKYMKQK